MESDPLNGTQESVKGRLKNYQVLVGISINNKPVTGVIGTPFSNGGLVDNDREEVGTMVLHRIVKVVTGILESRSGRSTVYFNVCAVDAQFVLVGSGGVNRVDSG